MRPLYSVVAAISLLSALARAGESERYSNPFRDVNVEAVSSVVIHTKADSPLIQITDKNWTKQLMATITEKDFPLRRGPMSFSLPGELCRIALKDERGESMRVITVYAAWNLLSVTDKGRSVLGSNRQFAKAVIQKIEESQPEYMRKQLETYGDQLTGKYEKEYWQILNGEQAGTGQPATRPESKSEGSDKPQPEAEGRSR